MIEHCKRASGTERAWFATHEDAVRFSRDPANIAYHGDIAGFCEKCQAYHLSPPEFKPATAGASEFIASDCQLLEEMGIGSNARMDEHFRCVVCGVVQREDVEFVILRSGDICCAEHVKSSAQTVVK
jgi:hypothetical protein